MPFPRERDPSLLDLVNVVMCNEGRGEHSPPLQPAGRGTRVRLKNQNHPFIPPHIHTVTWILPFKSDKVIKKQNKPNKNVPINIEKINGKIRFLKKQSISPAVSAA